MSLEDGSAIPVSQSDSGALGNNGSDNAANAAPTKDSTGEILLADAGNPDNLYGGVLPKPSEDPCPPVVLNSIPASVTPNAGESLWTVGEGAAIGLGTGMAIGGWPGAVVGIGAGVVGAHLLDSKSRAALGTGEGAGIGAGIGAITFPVVTHLLSKPARAGAVRDARTELRTETARILSVKDSYLYDVNRALDLLSKEGRLRDALGGTDGPVIRMFAGTNSGDPQIKDLPAERAKRFFSTDTYADVLADPPAFLPQVPQAAPQIVPPPHPPVLVDFPQANVQVNFPAGSRPARAAAAAAPETKTVHDWSEELQTMEDQVSTLKETHASQIKQAVKGGRVIQRKADATWKKIEQLQTEERVIKSALRNRLDLVRNPLRPQWSTYQTTIGHIQRDLDRLEQDDLRVLSEEKSKLEGTRTVTDDLLHTLHDNRASGGTPKISSTEIESFQRLQKRVEGAERAGVAKTWREWLTEAPEELGTALTRAKLRVGGLIGGVGGGILGAAVGGGAEVYKAIWGDQDNSGVEKPTKCEVGYAETILNKDSTFPNSVPAGNEPNYVLSGDTDKDYDFGSHALQALEQAKGEIGKAMQGDITADERDTLNQRSQQIQQDRAKILDQPHNINAIENSLVFSSSITDQDKRIKLGQQLTAAIGAQQDPEAQAKAYRDQALFQLALYDAVTRRHTVNTSSETELNNFKDTQVPLIQKLLNYATQDDPSNRDLAQLNKLAEDLGIPVKKPAD